MSNEKEMHTPKFKVGDQVTHIDGPVGDVVRIEPELWWGQVHYWVTNMQHDMGYRVAYPVAVSEKLLSPTTKQDVDRENRFKSPNNPTWITLKNANYGLTGTNEPTTNTTQQ